MAGDHQHDPIVIESDSDEEPDADTDSGPDSEVMDVHQCQSADESDDDLPSLKELFGDVSNCSTTQWSEWSDQSLRQEHLPWYINYASGRNAKVEVVDKLTRLLIDEKQDVVLVGEGNFTFSVAIATLRRSWDGITSTRYDPVDPEMCPEPQVDKIKLNSVASCIFNGLILRIEPSTILRSIHDVLCLQPPPDGTWLFGIDATNIPDDLNVQGKVVWFQCPWVPKNRQLGSTTSLLIEKFLEHMASKQSPNDYVLLGVANRSSYVKNYRLHKLLGDHLLGPVGDYNFLGADIALIRKILQYGYRHQGVKDIHKTTINDHVTLVFQRK